MDREGKQDRGPIRAPHPFLCTVGPIVPDMLGELLDAQGRRDGFIDRFLFAYPDPLPRMGWRDQGLSDETPADWAQIVNRLKARPMDLKEMRLVPHVARFTPDGKQAWRGLINAHHAEQRSPDFSQSLRGPWGNKLDEYAGRLTLILHLLELAADPACDITRLPDVPPRIVKNVARLLDYFKSHSRRVYAAIKARANGDEGDDDVQSICKWIFRHKPQAFTLRDLTHDLSRTFTKRPQALEEALAWLESVTTSAANRRRNDRREAGDDRVRKPTSSIPNCSCLNNSSVYSLVPSKCRERAILAITAILRRKRWTSTERRTAMTCLLSDPIKAIIARLYAGPEVRRGDRSHRLWWVCPFHDDRNPSLCVVPGESHYHCYGCGAHGDAIDFVRRLNPGVTFRDAVRAIEGDLPRSPDLPSPPPARNVTRSKPDRPEGWQNFARDVVDRAEAFLWSVRGAEARSYLRWRGLREETIRTARLGYWPDDEHVEDIFPDKKVWVPRGIVIPGFDGPDVEFINVRRPEGDPKYFAILGSRRDGLYPGRTGIVVGKPVSIVEGEFETLLLRQEIGDLIPVVTLGSAGNKPSARVKNTLLGASPWIVAGDADAAGEKSADDSMAQSDRYVRVAPPKGFGKGWTEAQEKGLDLRTWWQLVLDRLANRERPGEDGAHPTVPPHFIAGPVPIEGPSEPMLSAPSAREAVAACLDNWRLRWGGLANACSAQGMPAREAEEKAAVEVKAGLNAAGYGPPPAMDPDPYIALWLYELNDLIASGEAARHLPPGEFRRVQALPAGEPLDCEAMRSVVHAVRAQMWTERCRALGVPESPFDVDRWRCLSTTCLHKG